MVHADAIPAEMPCDHLLNALEQTALLAHGLKDWCNTTREQSEALDNDIRWQAMKQLAFFRDVLEKISHISDAKIMASLAIEALGTKEY